MAADDIRAQLPRVHSANVEKNLRLRSALEAIARAKIATLAQLSIAWPMAQGSRAGAFIVPIPGAKSRKHLEENVLAGILCSRQTISRKSTASYPPVRRPALAIR
jgi:aryl-alcohol dehydrogenase-like predicted oxidoreductase